jgi:ribosomal protein S3
VIQSELVKVDQKIREWIENSLIDPEFEELNIDDNTDQKKVFLIVTSR